MELAATASTADGSYPTGWRPDAGGEAKWAPKRHRWRRPLPNLGTPPTCSACQTSPVGSVREHNTAATDAYLPSLDAAILVTSADPPISRSERAFLERVAEQAVRLFVVLNKADYLTPAELERTVAFTERVIREVLPDWPGP